MSLTLTCHGHGGRLMVSACENIEQIEEEGKLGMAVDVYKQAVRVRVRVRAPSP